MARFADTLTDSGRWGFEERTRHLHCWEKAILQKDLSQWKLEGNVGSFTESEAELLLEGKQLLHEFQGIAPHHQLAGQDVLRTLIQGMKWDLKTFQEGGGAPSNNTTAVRFAIRDSALFDWYCYSIAGCVGAYWVKMFNLPSNLESLAVAYGKGLQRINIIRDVIEDWNRGRLYLPTAELAKFIPDFSEKAKPPWNEEGWKKFLNHYCQETKALLTYGAHFCDSIPKGQMRLRWSSSMPLVIGWATLEKIEASSPFQKGIKISRPEVRQLGFSTLLRTLLRTKFTPHFQKDLSMLTKDGSAKIKKEEVR